MTDTQNTDVTAAEDELVEIEIDADPAAEAAAPEAAAEKPAPTKADADAKDADDDDDDDDDDGSDERLNDDQRDDDDEDEGEGRRRKRSNGAAAKRRLMIRKKRQLEEERQALAMERVRLMQEVIETRANVLQVQAQQVERDIAEATRNYQIAERKAAEAMSSQNGVGFQQWDRRKQEAAAKYQQLNGLKARLAEGFQTLQQQWQQTAQEIQAQPAVQQQQEQRPRPVTDQHQRRAEAFVAEHAWIKDGGADADVVRALDLAVTADGFDPSMKSYWSELRDRMKHALPHRFKGQRSSPPVGSGRDSTGTHRVRVTAQEVQACKDAGYWEDPKERSDYFKRVLAAKKAESTRR
jgi:hypothetical protein